MLEEDCTEVVTDQVLDISKDLHGLLAQEGHDIATASDIVSKSNELNEVLTSFVNRIKASMSSKVMYSDTRFITQTRRLQTVAREITELAQQNFLVADAREAIVAHLDLAQHLLSSVCDLIPEQFFQSKPANLKSLPEESEAAFPSEPNSPVIVVDSAPAEEQKRARPSSAPASIPVACLAASPLKDEDPYSIPQDALQALRQERLRKEEVRKDELRKEDRTEAAQSLYAVPQRGKKHTRHASAEPTSPSPSLKSIFSFLKL